VHQESQGAILLSGIGDIMSQRFVLTELRRDEPGTRRHEPAIRRDEPATRRDEPATRRDEPATRRDEPATRRDSGKVLVGGYFSTFAGANRPLLARLDGSGAVDLPFNPQIESGPNISGAVTGLRSLPNGQFLVSGLFNVPGESNYRILARFSADGAHDQVFRPTITIFSLQDFVPQADGKILISGGFQDQGVNLNRLVRLMPDGSVDASFQPPALTGEPTSLVVQPDGLIIAAGAGVAVRLFPNGSVDSSFVPPAGTFDSARTVIAQPDGKILVCGPIYDGVNPIPRGLTRFHSNGTLNVPK
jgi:uncharacterized delta-60 repeat protein